MDEVLTIKTSAGKMSFYLPHWLEVATQSDINKLIGLIRTAGWIEYHFDTAGAYQLLLKHIDQIILADKEAKNKAQKERHTKIKMIIRKAAGE